jgi:hypothetical protein
MVLQATKDSLAQKQVFLVDTIQFYDHDLIQFLLSPQRPQNENKYVPRISLSEVAVIKVLVGVAIRSSSSRVELAHEGRSHLFDLLFVIVKVFL